MILSFLWYSIVKYTIYKNFLYLFIKSIIMKKNLFLISMFLFVLNGYSQNQKIDMSFKNEKYPYLIGYYKAIAIDGQTLYSYANCPLFPPGASSNLGDNWFETYLNSGYSSKYYGAQKLLKNVYINNNQKKYDNSIFSASFENNELTLLETKIINGKLTQKKQVFKNNFEVNSNDIIETYEIKEFTVGSGLILFSGKSKYSEKNILFVGNINNGKLISIDLPKLDNRFNYDKLGGTITRYFNGRDTASRYSINSVFQHNDMITVFISFMFGETRELIAIQVNSNTDSVKISNTTFIYGKNRIEINPQSIYNKQGGMYYLAESGGYICVMPGADKKTYINYDENKNIDFKLTQYDKNLIKTKETTLSNYTYINQIIEVGNYIIVGGYTKTKGYAGFANPLITVIDRSNYSITYEKCIPQKNSTVDLIKKDGQNIYIAISGSFDKNEPIKANIVVDKLNSEGKFENDLFTTNNKHYSKNNSTTEKNTQDNLTEKTEEINPRDVTIKNPDGSYQKIELPGGNSKIVKEYNADGVIISETKYNHTTGGNLNHKINYINGKKNGEVKFFDSFNDLYEVQNYLEGKKHGEFIRYDHPMRSEKGSYTGKGRYKVHCYQYRNDLKHGKQIVYYMPSKLSGCEQNNISSISYYENGIKIGETIYYNCDGTIKK